MDKRIYQIINEHACFFDIELEAKIGKLTNNGFVPGVTEEQFYTLKHEMDKSTAWNSKKYTQSTDVMCGDVRNVYETDKTYAIYKNRIQNVDFDYFRISVSEEKPCDVQDLQGANKSTRKKERWSYFYKMWRYDLTKVIQNNKINYEVEIELFDIALACQHTKNYLTTSFIHKIKQIKDTIKL